MHQNVNQVVGKRGQSPKLVFCPKSRLHQWTDAGGTAGPNVFQSQRTDDAGILCQVGIVVPNVAILQRRQYATIVRTISRCASQMVRADDAFGRKRSFVVRL